GFVLLGAEELRRWRPARRHRPAGSAAARAEGRQAHHRGRREQAHRLRVQDPGHNGPEPPHPPRARRWCARLSADNPAREKRQNGPPPKKKPPPTAPLFSPPPAPAPPA